MFLSHATAWLEVSQPWSTLMYCRCESVAYDESCILQHMMHTAVHLLCGTTQLCVVCAQHSCMRYGIFRSLPKHAVTTLCYLHQHLLLSLSTLQSKDKHAAVMWFTHHCTRSDPKAIAQPQALLVAAKVIVHQIHWRLVCTPCIKEFCSRLCCKLSKQRH